MAHILRLTDQSTTINFLGSSGTSWCGLVDGGLIIKTPTRKSTWSTGRTHMQGRKITSIGYENRQITIEFEIVGDDWDEILDMKSSISNLVAQAQERQLYEWKVPAVTLEYQLDTTTNLVSFDVLDGELRLPDNIMSVEGLGWDKGTQNTLKGIKLTLICKPFARGSLVTLANVVGIENTDDGYYDNYVNITGSNILGDVPCPVELSVKLGSSPSVFIVPEMLWVGVRDSGTPGDFIHVLEAEDHTYSGYGGSLTSQSTSYSGDPGTGSGGYAVQWTKTTTTEQTLEVFQITVDDLAQDTKGPVRVIAIGSFYTDSLYKFGYTPTGGSIESPLPLKPKPGLATMPYLDLGLLDMVPFRLLYGGSTYSVTYSLSVKHPDVSSRTTTLDAIFLIPAEEFKFRRYDGFYGETSGGSLSLIDSGIEDWVYTVFSPTIPATGRIHGSPSTIGLPIYVTPGRSTRIYFLSARETSYSPSTPLTVSVSQEPYYLDISGAA